MRSAATRPAAVGQHRGASSRPTVASACARAALRRDASHDDSAKSPLGLVFGLAAVLAGAGRRRGARSRRCARLSWSRSLGVTPTTAPAVVEQPKPVVTPWQRRRPRPSPRRPRPSTQTPAVITVDAGRYHGSTTQAITQTPVRHSRRPLTPNQRLAQVRDTFEAGNSRLGAGAARRAAGQSNPTLAGLDDAEYDIRMGFAQALVEQSNPDGAYEQYDGALKIRPGDAAAKAGQDQIILAKNYAIMEAAWGKDDDTGDQGARRELARSTRATARPAPSCTRCSSSRPIGCSKPASARPRSRS